jgi:hypothetical protein
MICPTNDRILVAREPGAWRWPCAWDLALVAILLLVAGCRAKGPTLEEEAVLAARGEAPLLDEPEDDAVPFAVLQRGTVVRRLQTDVRSIEWRGSLDGNAATRRGSIARVACGAAAGYVFKEDFTDRRAPAAAALCRLFGGEAACADRLWRVRLDDGRLLSFEQGGSGPRAVAVSGTGAPSVIRIDGVASVRVARLGGVDVALVRRRWADGDRSGARLVALRLGEQIEPVLDLGLDEVDARGAAVRQTLVDVMVEGDTLRRRGQAREVTRDGGVANERLVDETIRFTDGRPAR